MRINTQEEYDKIPDGTLLKLFFSGSSWGNSFGETISVIKIGDRLYKVADWFQFNERNDYTDPYDDYTFEIAQLTKY